MTATMIRTPVEDQRGARSPPGRDDHFVGGSYHVELTVQHMATTDEGEEAMAEEMTASTRRAFLTSGTRTAILATTRPDGRPHAVPIAFVLDNDDVVFVTEPDSVKGKAVRRDARVALVVDDETPPFAFVMIEGSAEVSRSPKDIEAIAPKIAERYDGPDAGPDAIEDFVRFARDQLGLLVRVKPTRMLALNRVGEH